jgi:hypothetical protein
MHLGRALPDDVSQLRCNLDFHSPFYFSIVQYAEGQRDMILLFQAHHLGCQLHLVYLVVLGTPMLILHRHGHPLPWILRMSNKVAGIIGRPQFYDVGDAIESQFMGSDAHGAERDIVAALLPIKRVIDMLMQDVSLRR